MPSNDIIYFKFNGELIASFDESDLVDFNWDDYLKYDNGQEVKIKAKNVSYEMAEKKDFKQYSEIPARLIHSKGDAIALSPGGWRPLAFIPNGAVVLFDKNAFGIIKKNINREGNPQPNAIKVVVDFFKKREVTIDPKPILLEGCGRLNKQLPTLDDMKNELEFFMTKMRERVPNLKVKATADSLPQLHSASAYFFQGLDAVLDFIEEVYKKYQDRHKFPKNLDGFKEVYALAKAANVQSVHMIFAVIVFKAVTGEKHNPILRLLKFNKPSFLEEGNSFNGALDIYSLLLFMSEIRNHNGNVFFVTADKDLIHLWNDICSFMMVNDERGVLHFDMTYFLPGLQQDEVAALQQLMTE